MKRTKQCTASDISVCHAGCTVSGCGFVVKYQNTLAVMSDKMKLILKVRTQMIEIMYKYFDLYLSASHRDKLYIYTVLDPT